ncbi:hypothetical protein [Pontibacter chinhatensis]|uniref:Uncharacterized protein n=1 Tax=Pontibacter chinhatensis TaxID=1436961 RepID=A0A1I2QI94_9BACT|nr:hypothetical protein [Pontibacter chinhatensis]SFG28315.1 hypothetical protein SAMN05421739_10228 [Pontibacter chinhatensis]
MIHHEPRGLPGYYIKLDKGWDGKEQRWSRGTPYRFIVQNITENIIGYIYLEEIQCYTRDDDLEETGIVPYEKSIYAGFMVQEVSKEEFRKLQKQKRDAEKK